MLLLDGHEEPLTLDAILVTAISGAQKLGLHRLGGIKLKVSSAPISPIEGASSTSTMPPHIRTEIGIRIWWALVLRDWSRGQALGYYSIQPSHFNTRMPLHINDDDLCLPAWSVNVNEYIPERDRSEFTKLSYTVHALELAGMVRESIDLRGPLGNSRRPEAVTAAAKTHLNRKYERFVSGLPSYFRLGSTAGLTTTGPMMAAIPVHRWMLHQQLWSLFLRLHRGNLSSPVGRAACQPLAQNVVSTQAQMQARCSVCCSLSTNDTQLFNAAVVLVLDLLFSARHSNPDDSSSQLSRLMARDKVREAIELLRPKGVAEDSAQRSVLVLEALMKLDEQESEDSQVNHGAPSKRSHSRRGDSGAESEKHPLKTKVVQILKTLNQQGTVSMDETEQIHPDAVPPLHRSLSHTREPTTFSDLDVLPILNNGPSPNYWQFMDFPSLASNSYSQNPPFSTSGDFQNPFSPTSGATQSLSNFSTPGFTDTYSSTDATRFTEPSPSYMEGDPGRYGGGSEPAALTPSSADVYAAKYYYPTDQGRHTSL